MSSAIARSRLGSLLKRHNRRALSSDASIGGHKEPVGASRHLASDQAPPPPPEEPAPPAEEAKKRNSFLSYSVDAAVLGALATIGYVSYAYSADEVDEKTKAFRASVKNPGGDSGTALDNFLTTIRCAAMTVPAKTVDLYLDLRREIEDRIEGFIEPTSDKLLPDLHPADQNVFTLVLDVNETIVYSNWTRDRGWRTFKRPGVDAFLEQLGRQYEIVIYTDQLPMYVDPIVARLDTRNCIPRLTRTATKYLDGKHYKDLSKLNRDPGRVIYISTNVDTCFQPENCIQIKPWKLEMDDTALLDLIPFLEFVASRSPADIRTVLASYEGKDIPSEFVKRSLDHRRMRDQRQGMGLWRR